MFWVCIGRLADILGILGFFASIVTILMSVSIKKKISSSIELYDYSTSKPEYISKISGFIQTISNDQIGNVSTLLFISEMLTTIEKRFSNLTSETINKISDIKNFIGATCKDENNKLSPSDRLFLVNNLSHLRELLRKEDRNYD